MRLLTTMIPSSPFHDESLHDIIIMIFSNITSSSANTNSCFKSNCEVQCYSFGPSLVSRSSITTAGAVAGAATVTLWPLLSQLLIPTKGDKK